MPHIVGSVFGPIRFLLPICRFCWFLYIFNIHLYMHIFHHIFLSNYWWQESDIWSQASYRYAILWEAFLDLSDSSFLFVDLVGFYTHWTYGSLSKYTHFFLFIFWWHQIFSFPFCFSLLVFPTLQWHIYIICSRGKPPWKKIFLDM